MRAGPWLIIRRILPAFLNFAAGGLAAGCSHYQLGTQGKLAFTTLYVAPVENKTLVPQAQAPVATQVRDLLAKDGRVEIVNSPETADVTLRIVISDFRREVAAVREQDTGLASEFSETMSVLCTLRDNRSGRDFFTNRVLKAQRDVFVDNGDPHSGLVGNQLQAEYNTMPLLAQGIADRVAHTVLDVW